MPEIRHLFRGFRRESLGAAADRHRADRSERRSRCCRRRSSMAARCSMPSRRARSRTKRWWPTRASKARCCSAIRLRAAHAARHLVRAGVDRVPGLRAAAGDARRAFARRSPTGDRVAVYGLLLFFCGAVLPGMAIAIIARWSPPAVAPLRDRAHRRRLTSFLFVAAQAISDYVAYRDIFHAGEAAPLPNPRLANRLARTTVLVRCRAERLILGAR